MIICITILFEKLKYYHTDRWFHSGDSPVEPVCKALFYLNYLMDFMMSCIKVPQPFGTMEPTNEWRMPKFSLAGTDLQSVSFVFELQ